MSVLDNLPENVFTCCQRKNFKFEYYSPKIVFLDSSILNLFKRYHKPANTISVLSFFVRINPLLQDRTKKYRKVDILSHPSIALRPYDAPGPGCFAWAALWAARTPRAPRGHLAVNHWGILQTNWILIYFFASHDGWFCELPAAIGLTETKGSAVQPRFVTPSCHSLQPNHLSSFFSACVTAPDQKWKRNEQRIDLQISIRWVTRLCLDNLSLVQFADVHKHSRGLETLEEPIS